MGLIFGTQTLPEAAIALSPVAHGVTRGGGSPAGAGGDRSSSLGTLRPELLGGQGTQPDARPERDRDRCDRRWRVVTVGLSQAGQEARALCSASRDTFPELPPSACLTGQGEKGKENRRCCRKIHPDQSPKGSKLLYKPERFLTVPLG